MSAPGRPAVAPPGGFDLPLSDAEFERLRELVHRQTGIALSPQKRALVQARLGRRVRALGLGSFAEYHRYLTEREGCADELVRFTNAMTTNKTDFFREEHHFRHLTTEWAPRRIAAARAAGDRTVRFWSAGCSTGEEPYTIAMVLREILGGAGPGWDVRILASDIDTDVLARAEAGCYTAEQVAPVPRALLAQYFTPERTPDGPRARVRPDLRALVAFRRINLLDPSWPVRARFDAIFCRNVLIYFDRSTQVTLLGRFAGYLKDDGLLFLGHSEGALGLLAGLAPVATTVYARPPQS